MKELDGECVPEKGDPVAVTVPGRIWGLQEQQGVPGAFVSYVGNDAWFPLSVLMPENNGWVVEAISR